MPTIKKTQQQESRATADRRGSKSLSEQQGSKCTNQSCWKTTNHSRASCFIRSRMTSRPHRLKKTSSMQSKRRDLHHAWLHRETNEKLSFYCYSPRWITTTFSMKLSHVNCLSKHEKHLTKAAACCNDRKLFFMERWIPIVAVKDAQVEINHYINLFGVKSRKEGIVEALRTNGNVNVEEYNSRIA